MKFLSNLAKAKRLPISFLKSLGVEDSPEGLVIPYRHLDGTPARFRLRKGLSSKDGWSWLGEGPILPYGLWRLSVPKVEKLDISRPRAIYGRNRGILEVCCQSLVLVEGESDTWTLWYHGIRALGFPGSSTTKTLMPEYLRGVDTIYAWKEPDKGGELFISGLSKRLYEIGFSGSAKIIESESKDPSELYLKTGKEFIKTMKYLMNSSKPMLKYDPPKPKPLKSFSFSGKLEDWQIEKAKDYPIEELLGVKRGAKILCPFHPDKRPSMWAKTYCYCFVCGASMNSISYLMREGKSFTEAVGALQ